MGTRAYAEEVCAVIDPDRKVFGGRILSRDESGSECAKLRFLGDHLPLIGLTQKSLQRLFPCDTSMVVIIDDRADVWEWSLNLIKVIPCELQGISGITSIDMRIRRLLRRNRRYQLCVPAESRTTSTYSAYSNFGLVLPDNC
jgi:TFIIF-interacting CTD phosphatase-like protein